MIVSFIGYRGSGKTTVARRLAKQLHWPCVDSDDEVERQSDSRIADIFAEHGEAEFRRLEACCIRELLQQDPLVLSLGGGAILREETAEAVAARGPIVWLQCDVDTLARRIGLDGDSSARRPRLTSLPPRQEIERLLAEREPIYARWATWRIDSSHQRPEEIARQVAALIRTKQESS